MDDALINLLH